MSFFNHRVEIPLILVFIPFMLESSTTNNFIIYRTCYASLGYNESDCVLLGTNDESDNIQKLEAIVQPTASLVIMLRSVLTAILSAFYCFVVGPWSTKYGRKPIMVGSLIGILLTYLTFMVVTLIKWGSPWWTLLTTITTILGGGFCGLLAVIYCYVSDITTEKTRSIRMGILDLCVGLGCVCGTLACSYLLNPIGYSGIYGVCVGFTALSLLYVYFFLNESVTVIEKKDKLRNLFNLTLILQTIKVVTKPRQKYKRLLLFLLISLLVFDILPLWGEATISLLFLRKHFNWSLTQCNLYSAASGIVNIVASAFILAVIYKALKVRDMTIVLCLFSLMGVGSVIFGFAKFEWEIYFGSYIKQTDSSLAPLTRSAISTIISPDELGAVFAFTTSLEMLTEVIASPLYTLIYNSTLDKFDNAFNLISVAIYVIAVGATSAVIFIRKRERSALNSTIVKS